MSKLILIRHGQSEWNKKGLWTGWNNIGLTNQGRKEAQDAAKKISNIHIDYVFVSDLKRSVQTYEEIKKTLKLTAVPVVSTPAIKERDYGDLAGKNKWEIKKQVGEEQFLKWRRGWNEPIPGGETLKDVYERVVPYYKKHILPLLINGQNILVCAHGNSIRALIKHLENISDKDISQLEIGTGEVYVYGFDKNGNIINKNILSSNTDKYRY